MPAYGHPRPALMDAIVVIPRKVYEFYVYVITSIGPKCVGS